MFIVFLVYFHLLVSDATVLLDVNTTAGTSTTLPCALMTITPIDLERLRFYWQDERNHVWFSFNEGKEIPEHVHEFYQDRITAFQQQMTTGNISVNVKTTTLEDDQRVLQAFAAVFDSRESGRYSHKHRQICKMTLHVSVPYKNVRLTVNEESMTAVCTTHGGFPEPLVKWSLQFLSNNSQHFLDPRDVHTTAVQDPRDRLYNLSSTVNIPGETDRHLSITCLIHNPTLNVTLNDTRVLSKGEAVMSLSGLTSGLTAAVVLLLSARQ